MLGILVTLLTWWRDVSIAKKLYGAVGIMAALIAVELGTVRFAMHTLSAVRAFVQGEGLWSKAQKNAAFSIQRYSLTRNERDYLDFLEYLKIPEGDHRARLALLAQPPEIEKAAGGFVEGRIHPDDTMPMIELLLRFHWISYLSHAIGYWGEGDRLLAQFKDASIEYHDNLISKIPNRAKLEAALTRIQSLNRDLTDVEERFSNELGEGSRWMEHLIIVILTFAVLMVESIGLTLTIFTTRSITRGLDDLNDAAQKIGAGDFRYPLKANSQDEIGVLTRSIQAMESMLDQSYSVLETRVRERTAELEAMAAENARLYRKAQEAVHVRDDFISVAAHELKTPATALYLQLQMLIRVVQEMNDAPSAQSTQKYAEKSLEQANRLNALLEKLLDMTRIRIGTLELKTEICDLGKLVKNMVSDLEIQAEKSHSRISMSGPLTLQARIDPIRIRQVLGNLISNAIKYGEGQPISVLLAQKGEFARIEVVDSGIGIPTEKQPRIFEQFERAVSDKSISGLGLGLFVAKQIILAHGGTISVQSQPGQGSRFICEFPLNLKSVPQTASAATQFHS